MVNSDHWCNIIFEEFVYQITIILDAKGIDLIGETSRQDARPGYGEPVNVNSELVNHLSVPLVEMVGVSSDVRVTAIFDKTFVCVHQVVPYTRCFSYK